MAEETKTQNADGYYADDQELGDDLDLSFLDEENEDDEQ